MQMKRILIASLWCLMIAACASQQVAFTTISTNVPLPSATFTMLPISTDTPYPTSTPRSITPVAFNADIQDINQIIDNTYYVPSSCKLNWIDRTNNQPPYNATVPPDEPPTTLDFVDITEQVNWDNIWIREIADSTKKSYRAYLVEESIPEACDACVLSRIYVENRINGYIYRIDFQAYKPWRILYNLNWVGDSVVVFAQSASPSYSDIIGVNVEKKEYVYVASFSKLCPSPLIQEK